MDGGMQTKMADPRSAQYVPERLQVSQEVRYRDDPRDRSASAPPRSLDGPPMMRIMSKAETIEKMGYHIDAQLLAMEERLSGPMPKGSGTSANERAPDSTLARLEAYLDSVTVTMERINATSERIGSTLSV